MSDQAIQLMQGESLKLVQGDSLELMSFIPTHSIDLVVTDPAYWTLDKYRTGKIAGSKTRFGGNRDEAKRDDSQWFETVTPSDLYELLCDMGRVLKPNRHAWVMCDGETSGMIWQIFNDGETGFDYCKLYPVLKRTADGKAYRTGMGYHGRGCHEYVMLLEKGRRRFTTENWCDVFEAPWAGDSETRSLTANGKGFPTAKPVSLFRRWIELSSLLGETVLDYFTGSGTTGAACIETGRRFIGIEKSVVNCAVAQKRLHHTSPSLFADDEKETA